MALQNSANIEDRHALAGNVALLFGDYARAQELFLLSTRPICALEMRKDLLQWDQALKLAQTLAPNYIPDICLHYGQQLEFKDETEKSLHMYEMCLNATGIYSLFIILYYCIKHFFSLLSLSLL